MYKRQLLFGPFAVLPGPLVWGLLGVFSLLALGTVVRVALGPAGHRLRWWGWAVVVGAGLAAEPVWRTLGFGQVNLVLLALVVVDVLVLRGSRGAGLLTGLAAAVKLTPLVFVGHLWLTGRRADAGRALAAFGLCHAVGGVLLPGDSLRYWTVVVLDPSRPGDNAYWGNQSLNGLVHRLAGGADWALVLSGALGVGVLAVGALVVSGRWRAAAPLDPLAALLVTAGCGLLVSPVSWTHHWVWVVPLGCWLARPLLARPLLAAAPVARRWPPVLALAALGVVFTGWCWWLVPGGGHAELAWTPLESVVGNSYALAGLVGLAAVLSLVRRGRAADRRCEVAAAR